MIYSAKRLLSGAFASAMLMSCAPNAATAMPASTLAMSVAAPPAAIEAIRYRRHARRYNNNGGAAVLGLFGAVLGGVIANQRYHDYSDYNYGPRYGYGYSRGYSYGPSYGGGWRRGGGYYGQDGGYGGRGFYGRGGGYGY